jgi:thiol-disulfide isomerase/thioredoxin
MTIRNTLTPFVLAVSSLISQANGQETNTKPPAERPAAAAPATITKTQAKKPPAVKQLNAVEKKAAEKKAAENKIYTVKNIEEFQETLKTLRHNEQFAILLTADWCGPCRTLKPKYDGKTLTTMPLIKVDGSDNEFLSKLFDFLADPNYKGKAIKGNGLTSLVEIKKYMEKGKEQTSKSAAFPQIRVLAWDRNKVELNFVGQEKDPSKPINNTDDIQVILGIKN